MQLTFLVSCDGTNARRGHARRACNSCRHKKKRCYHSTPQEQLADPTSSPDISSLTSRQSPASRVSRRDSAVRNRSASPRGDRSSASSLQNPVEEQAGPFVSPDAGTAAEVHQDQESRRFACDSNPIATLIEQNESRLLKGRSQKGDVGAWLSAEESSIDSGDTPSSSSQPALETHVHTDWLPPKDCQEALIDIYFRQIHPLLPLLNEDDVRTQHRAGSLPPQLVQVICLVAAKDRGAVPFLYLGPDSNILPLERFSNIIYTDVMQKISRRAEKKTLAIQILALLSLHEWGSSGSEDCSLNLAQAIHHAHTVGLHLLRPDEHTDPSCKSLFWCLWSLDRWNAAMNGRPLMIHDGDRNHVVDDVASAFQSPFRVWLRIAEKLGEVIHFYRPIMKGMGQAELDLPTFEDLVDHCEAWDMSRHLLESLEFVYHSVIILSTHSHGLQGRSRPRELKIRQGHSILTIASLSCNHDIRNFLPFPMIGYTISLAFTVTYKQLRESKLPSSRHTAISQLRLLHQCLKEMGTTWWSAAVMARLGQRVLNNIQPTIDQECSTGPETNITRLNSHHESTDISSRPLLSTDDMAHVGRRIDAGSESTHPLSGHRLGSDKPSNFEVDGTPFLTPTEIEDFDTFFGNFLDVGFPNCANDQLLLDRDMPDFEFVPHGLA